MKGRTIHYSADELVFIHAISDCPRWMAHAAFVRFFGRDDVSLDTFAALCVRKGWMTGRSGHFETGQQAWNKRRNFNPQGSEKGRFKAGHEPHNTKYLGHERVSRDGYVEISVAETNPYTGFERRYVQKHRYLWEQANGPVPAGHVLKCLDGDKTNTDPANWAAIPRALLPRLNGIYGRGYDAAAPELKPTILATAELEHAARQARKARTECEKDTDDG